MKVSFTLLTLAISAQLVTGNPPDDSTNRQRLFSLPVAASETRDPAALPPGVPESELRDMKPDYPKPMFVGTPMPVGHVKNLETLTPEALKKRLTFKIPKDATNVALHKKVISSDPLPIIGGLGLITDGDADGADDSCVELSPGKQWVQIDLNNDYRLWKILLWHFHQRAIVCLDVVVQISNDPNFHTDVTTIFNNDVDNHLGFGFGKDKCYVETNHGRLIDAQGIKGRYVRLWSNGSTENEMNHYIEVSVYGSPAQ